jgi:hypothetical protein
MAEETTTITAEAFVKQELADAQKQLRNTQIIGSIIVLALGIYVIAITAGFVGYLQPKSAVQLATGFINGQIDDNKDAVLAQLKDTVDSTVASIPEFAKTEIPRYRQQVQDTFKEQLSKTLDENSSKLDESLQDYLEKNKEQIHALLDTAKSKEALKAIGPTLQTEIEAILNMEPEDGGQSINAQIIETQRMFIEARDKVHKLAVNKNLSETDKKARRAMAIIANTVAEAGIEPVTLPQLGAADEAAADDEAAPAAKPAKK